MFDKDKAFYKNGDYTVRMEKIDNCERYFIKYHSQTVLPEQEINLEMFTLYYSEFRKPMDKQRNEHRRHIDGGEIDSLIISGKLSVTPFDKKCSDKVTFEAILKTCTEVQQRRFELHLVQGYTLAEIAKMDGCDYSSVRESVRAVKEKIKKYFL